MSKKWGNAAKAIGQGVLQMGMMNQRSELEAKREANMERIRNENRQWQLDDRASQNEHNAAVLKTQNDHQAQVRETQNQHQASVLAGQNQLVDERTALKTTNDNEQNALNRKSRENQAALKAGKDGTKFARDEIVRLDKQIGSIGSRIASIRADQETLYEPGEKKAIIAALEAKADKYDKQINFITKKNPTLNDIFGKESMSQEKLDKAKGAADNLSKNSDRMNNAFSMAKGIADATSKPKEEKKKVVKKQEVKSAGNEKTASPAQPRFEDIPKNERPAFLKKSEKLGKEKRAMQAELIEQDYKENYAKMSQDEKNTWVKKLKSLGANTRDLIKDIKLRRLLMGVNPDGPKSRDRKVARSNR